MTTFRWVEMRQLRPGDTSPREVLLSAWEDVSTPEGLEKEKKRHDREFGPLRHEFIGIEPSATTAGFYYIRYRIFPEPAYLAECKMSQFVLRGVQGYLEAAFKATLGGDVVGTKRGLSEALEFMLEMSTVYRREPETLIALIKSALWEGVPRPERQDADKQSCPRCGATAQLGEMTSGQWCVAHVACVASEVTP